MTRVGSVGSAGRHAAAVDPRGLVSPRPSRWSLDWWIGADDRWHFPAEDAAVRQQLLGHAPVVETAMRVPGGDAVHRAYAVPSGPGDLLVVEIENRSPVPFAVALAVTGARRVGADRATVKVDKRAALLLAKPPARMAAGDAEEVRRVVTSGGAGTELVTGRRGKAGSAAFVFPLAHTATLRLGIPLAGAPDRLPATVPNADDVAKGWAAHAEAQVPRIELPPGRLADTYAAHHRFALLFGVQAATGQSRDSGPALHDLLDTTSPGQDPEATAAFLAAVHDLLVHETPDGLAIAPHVPDDWTGQGWEVHDMPTASGTFSYAVRWHGERPALLWDLQAPAGTPARITAPRLHPTWSTTDRRGEALLA